MTDLPVPKAEAKPSIPIEARAVMARLDLATRALPRDIQARVFVLAGELFDVGVAFGRGQAAVDVRGYAESLRSTSWNPSTGVALGAVVDAAARIAAGSTESDEPTGADVGESMLPASSTVPIPRAETKDR